jgi:hypothetical protein
VTDPVSTTFDLAAFEAELQCEPNRAIATRVLLENEGVRVWELKLEPGERARFHWHTNTYFFVCVDGGRARSRFPNGHLIEMDYEPGFSFFTEEPTEESPEIHDLENIGTTSLRFTTVELLAR